MLIDVGSRRPLGTGAGSQALAAFTPCGVFDKILESNALRYPQFRALTVDQIRIMVAEARQRGYGVSDGLWHEDVVSIGVPVFDRQGQVIAAISVSAIRSRMPEARWEKIVTLVREKALAGVENTVQPYGQV